MSQGPHAIYEPPHGPEASRRLAGKLIGASGRLPGPLAMPSPPVCLDYLQAGAGPLPSRKLLRVCHPCALMGNSTPGLDEAVRYYRGALACLAFVEARRPTKRRFGPDADARWKAFRGHLSASDRIDLLLRDANAEWPGAFGAREVFGLVNAAEDEAFGAQWVSLDGVRGDELWRELSAVQVASAPVPLAALESVAKAWGLSLRPVQLDPVDPADRVIVAGPSAVAALAALFAGRVELDWAVQVTCVASPPAHRQVALSACAVVDTHKPCRVLAASEAPPWPVGARLVVSDDAAAEDLAAVQVR